MAKTKVTKATYSRKIDKNGKLVMELKSVRVIPKTAGSIRGAGPDSDSDLEGYDSSYDIPKEDWKWHTNQIKKSNLHQQIKSLRTTVKRHKINKDIRVPKPQAKEGSEENPITID